MDLGFNHDTWPGTWPDSGRGTGGRGGASADGGSLLDWHGLRARLLAARAARRALASAGNAGPCAAGASFDAQAARQLRGHGDCFTPVNPVSLTVRKTGADNVAAVVGETRTGDRG